MVATATGWAVIGAGWAADVARHLRLPERGGEVAPGALIAPMPGKVVKLGAAVGDVVAAAIQVANDSLSHRSSHQRGVTRSPNHWWASSWATTARSSRRPASDGRAGSASRIDDANRISPGFSIAPKNCGTATRSSLASGSGRSK